MSEAPGVWTSEEVALLLIDYQKEMFENVKSETTPDEIDLNVRFLIRAAKAFNIPVVLSSVGVTMGVNGPTRASITDELPGLEVIDRSSMNAWEDAAFRAAVEKTGRKRLIFGALYTEICLAFPIIDAMRAGYEAMFVVDAVGARASDVAVAAHADRHVDVLDCARLRRTRRREPEEQRTLARDRCDCALARAQLPTTFPFRLH